MTTTNTKRRRGTLCEKAAKKEKNNLNGRRNKIKEAQNCFFREREKQTSDEREREREREKVDQQEKF